MTDDDNLIRSKARPLEIGTLSLIVTDLPSAICDVLHLPEIILEGLIVFHSQLPFWQSGDTGIKYIVKCHLEML